MFDLSGQRVLVTGGSKGIGAATAVAFARAGASVAIHYATDAQGARATLEAARANAPRGAAFCVLPAYLEDWDAAARLVPQTIDALGGLDVVVANHGIWKEAAIDAMTEAQYDETFDANLRGVFALSGAAVRAWRAAGARGRLITVASTAGQRGEALHSHYAATKGALISFTKSLATELAPHGILVNCVAPGWVRTAMSEPALGDVEVRARVHASIPLGRVGEPDEIAGPIVFLASPAASFMTGEILNVNGGAVLVG